jgi:hypothetical protein
MQEEILHSFMHARTTDPCFWLLGPTPFFFSVSPSSPQINFPKLHSEAHRQRCYISLFNFSTRLFMFCVFLLGASYSFFYVLWLRARFFVCMSQISTPPDPFPAPPPTPANASLPARCCELWPPILCLPSPFPADAISAAARRAGPCLSSPSTRHRPRPPARPLNLVIVGPFLAAISGRRPWPRASGCTERSARFVFDRELTRSR